MTAATRRPVTMWGSAPRPRRLLFSVPTRRTFAMLMVDFKALERAVGMERVLHLLGWEEKERRGNELRGRCPIHSSPSSQGDAFAVRGGKWYCHKCCQGGGLLRLYYLTTRQEPLQGALDLCKRLGVPVPHLAPRTRRRGVC